MDTLPDEIIIEQCEKLSMKDLVSFMKTSVRHYEVCKTVMNEKKTSLLDIIRDPDNINSILKETIQRCYVHPVTFTMVWGDFSRNEVLIRMNRYDPIDETVIQDLSDFLNWDTVVFPTTTLSISSDQNGNDDTRGGGCGNINIPIEEFLWSVETPNGTTIRHLTEAVYRMKGSKYDWWYELFGDIEYGIYDNVLNVKVSFDYGS